MSRAPLVLLLALLVAACRPQPESPAATAFRIAKESAEAETAMGALNIRYMRYLNENQPDSIASLFLEDGVLMAPGFPAIQGRREIRDFYAENPMPPGARIYFEAITVHANGPMMIERGEYATTIPATATTKADTVTGKYLVHWRAHEGRWQQVATIWNEDRAP
jgi:ketosteroid isomerase-like protein